MELKPEQLVAQLDSGLQPAYLIAGPEPLRVLEAAEYIPVAQLGTTDDCGFAAADATG